MHRLALVIEYDGTNYKGFQLQTNHPTIQGEIESSLAKFTGRNIRIRGASRTDSGAHATGQVVDFINESTHPIERFPSALNYYLPSDIKVQAGFQVPLEFNSRRYATSRTYRYNIVCAPWPSPLRKHTHYWVREELQIERMVAAARDLVGVHDFRVLATGHPLDKSAVRRVYRWEVRRDHDTLIIECEATGFLRHQIRKANSLLIQVGKERCSENIIRETLESQVDSYPNVPALPAHGLCLTQVTYPQSLEALGSGAELDDQGFNFQAEIGYLKTQSPDWSIVA